MIQKIPRSQDNEEQKVSFTKQFAKLFCKFLGNFALFSLGKSSN
jgi:hypothetical protein